MEAKQKSAECPICKNPISRENLIPIYVKDENKENTNRFKIPKRPKGQRENNQDSQNYGTNSQNVLY